MKATSTSNLRIGGPSSAGFPSHLSNSTPETERGSSIATARSVRYKPMNVLLWILQVLLAVLFLFAGGIKLIVPPAELMAMGPPDQIQFPGWFLQFIGVMEVLGGLGLVLPRLLNIRPQLTALAAAGLVIVMIGATVTTAMSGQIAGAAVPMVVGLLCAFVAYKRGKSNSHAARAGAGASHAREVS
jgi:uncharacterized membrane protein YphA (DoxX/SURF4 family)